LEFLLCKVSVKKSKFQGTQTIVPVKLNLTLKQIKTHSQLVFRVCLEQVY
jgi:hypothetical protein